MLPQKIPQILLKTDVSLLKCPVRCKGHGPNHWSVLRRTKFPKDRALEHFDDFYANVYGSRKWRSMRLALLCDKKYCAVVNNYSDTDRIVTKLENRGAVNVRKIFQLQAEKLAEENVISLEPSRADTVHKLDAKMDKISSAMMKKEMQKLFPELPSDKAMNFIEAANSGEVEPEPPLPERPRAKALEEDEEIDFPPATFDEAGSLEVTEEEIKSRLVRSGDVLHNFVPATKLQGMETFIPESHHYGYYRSESEFPIFISEDGPINFPKNLNVYTYEQGNICDFKPPKRGSTDLFDYFLLDGASLFPVLALNLQPDDRVLDMCAAPGGKSLMILQTLYPRFLTCNDNCQRRMQRLKRILKDYFQDIDDKVSLSIYDGAVFKEEPNFYNKEHQNQLKEGNHVAVGSFLTSSEIQIEITERNQVHLVPFTKFIFEFCGELVPTRPVC